MDYGEAFYSSSNQGKGCDYGVTGLRDSDPPDFGEDENEGLTPVEGNHLVENIDDLGRPS